MCTMQLHNRVCGFCVACVVCAAVCGVFCAACVWLGVVVGVLLDVVG